MGIHVNSLLLLLRAPANYGTTFQRQFLVLGRRLHSDTPNVAAVRAAPAEEPRPPLMDLHGRRHNYLRISLTERCNLRCQYCMPAEGVPLSPRERLLSRAELARLVRLFAALGVDKVRLTGGEPTLRKDLAEIIQDISSVAGIGCVSMTTNGLVLTRRLPALQRAGLAALNVSLDSLRPPRYEHMARRPGLAKVLAGIDLALQLGYRPVKINVVLMKGFNDDEICDFAEYTRDREVEVRFIEFMPFSGNAWDGSKLVPQRQALRALAARYPELQARQTRPNDTARVWQVPGYAGSVGFISSMTNNFCSTCNRLRLTADGNLKVCLFGAAEVSLRDLVRDGVSDMELEDVIRAALRNKKPQHAASPLAAGHPAHSDHRPALRGSWTTSKISPLLTVPLQQSSGLFSVRCYSSDAGEGSTALSHLDASGRARMVDVGHKEETQRRAAAACRLRVNARLLRLLRDARLPKGDALTVAQIAGVMASKRTSDIIPMCHQLKLDCARVTVSLPKGECAEGGDITIHCEVRTHARTGVEMEALTGAAVAALALYDMCKAVDKRMTVTDLKVIHKSGGKSGDYPPPEDIKVRDHDTSKVKAGETYVPTNLMHF